MNIEILEKVYILHEQKDKKEIALAYHPLHHYFVILKTIQAPFNEHIYEILKANPHPGFAQIYDIEINDDVLYVVEEFINGPTLEYIMNEHISESVINAYIISLCDVLEFLHHLHPPIIHRDIKPANIIVQGEQIKLIDFDISRQYDEGQMRDTVIMGSVGYAAPEQYGFQQSDPRTDIYAMGILINELYTGKLPNEQLVEGKLGELIRVCMSLDPNQRYATISDLRKSFQQAIEVKEIPIKKKQHKPDIKWLSFDILCVFIAINTFVEYYAKASISDAIYEASIMFLALYSIHFISCNFYGIRDITRFNQSSKKIIRFLNAVLVWTMSLFAIIIFSSLIKIFLAGPFFPFLK